MSTTSNTQMVKPDLAAQCLTLLPDMMIFIVLALQMGHELKDTLHDHWSRLKTATHSILR